MSDRRRQTANTAGRDAFREIHQRLDRIERQQRSLQTGLVSNGVVQLIGNGAIKMTVVKTGVEDGRQVIFENVVTGSTAVLDLP